MLPVSTPQWARDKDRDAAIKLVEAAWANGQIVEADRDKRVEELRRAETLTEVQMLTHDLQPPLAGTPAPGTGAAAAPFVVPASWPVTGSEPAASGPAASGPGDGPDNVDPDLQHELQRVVDQLQGAVASGSTTHTVHYGPPVGSSGHHPAASTKKVSKAVFLVPLIIVAVVAVGIVGGIAALVNAISDGVSNSGGIFSDEPVDVLSVEGYGDLVDAVREESGSTTAFSAVLYPTYAVVELPVDTTTQHEDYWYWDGHDLTSNDVKSNSSFPRTDLADIDPQVVVDTVRKVRAKMSDESSWYAIVRAPDDSGAVIWAYASNEYGDSVYVGAKADGTITYDSTKH